MITIWTQRIPKLGDTVRYGSESHQIPSDIGIITKDENNLLEIKLEAEIIYISNKTELLTKN